MTPEQIVKIPARVLSQQQREDYFTNGYILLERFIGDEWLKKLRDATNELVEQSKKVTKSDTIFDLEPDHTPHSLVYAEFQTPPSIILFFGSM